MLAKANQLICQESADTHEQQTKKALGPTVKRHGAPFPFSCHKMLF